MRWIRVPLAGHLLLKVLEAVPQAAAHGAPDWMRPRVPRQGRKLPRLGSGSLLTVPSLPTRAAERLQLCRPASGFLCAAHANLANPVSTFGET